jgi:predicted DNA-binding protein (MmcQ/YjbR family)
MATFERVRELAMALPEATEQIAWEVETTWRIRGKIFAMGTAESGRISVKATKEEQAELVASRPEAFEIAPYVGRFGWVTVTVGEVGDDELAELLIESWRQIAPKRLVAAYDSAAS